MFEKYPERKALRYCDKTILRKLTRSGSGQPGIYLLGTSLHENVGDAAITIAEHRFFREYFPESRVIEIPSPLYLKFKPYLIDKIRPADIICCSGGGNLGDMYPDEEWLRRDAISTFTGNRIIIFPQTVFFSDSEMGKAELARSLEIYRNHPDLTVYVREKKSFAIMTKYFTGVTVQLMPDFVLSLASPVRERKRSGALMCLRSDGEGILSERSKQDIAELLQARSYNIRRTDTCIGKWLHPKQREKALAKITDQFAGASIVVTDRLHGMIFAALTGTPCIVIGTGNHKVASSCEWLEHLDYIRFNNDMSAAGNDMDQLMQTQRAAYDYMWMKTYLDSLAVTCRNRSLKTPAAVSFVVVTNASQPDSLTILLDSMKPLCDERVVILDNDNIDTFRMLSEHAENVKVCVGKGSFEAYTPDILRHCRSEWIFRLDDDESLDSTWTRETFDRYITDRTAVAYWIPRKWYITEKTFINIQPWFPDHQLRLFKNLPEITSLPAQIHDSLKVSGEIRRIDSHFIDHWDLIRSNRKSRENKVARYQRLRPDNGNEKYYLFEDYAYDVQYDASNDDGGSSPCGDPGDASKRFEEQMTREPSCSDFAYIISSHKIPQTMKAGLPYAISVTIRNHCGATLFPGNNTYANFNRNVFLSYHWFDSHRKPFVWDNERYLLPDYLRLHEALDAVISAAAPPEPGEYYLQADIVEEGIRWYSLSENCLYSQLVKVVVI